MSEVCGEAQERPVSIGGFKETGVLAGGSSDCITDRCIELRYYGNADTGKGPVEEPGGEFFTFVDQQKVAVAIVDLTRQIVLHSEVFK